MPQRCKLRLRFSLLHPCRIAQSKGGLGREEGKLSGCSPLCAHIPASEHELMDLLSVKFFVNLGNLLKWIKTRHL